MSKRRLAIGATLAVVAAAVAVGVAQRRGYRYDGRVPDRGDVPEWQNDPEFDQDVFTFVRICYTSYRGGYYGGWRRGGGGWRTDWPASDLNFSFRLQQLTSLKVNPEPISLDLTDPKLFDYPFIYLVEPGALGSARRRSRPCAATWKTAAS